MKPPVIIGIATIEERRESLVETLESLRGQCDGILVYANSFRPGYLGDWDNVFIQTIENDLGDIGKFFRFFDFSPGTDEFPASINKFPLVDRDHYQLVCDDDLIYPPDYVETLIAGIERHDRKAVMGFHGKEYYAPVASYYRDFNDAIQCDIAANYRCLDEVAPRKNYPIGDTRADHQVTIIGTGCTGWHSSLFKDNPLSMDDFRHPNMADIWFSKKCNDLGIPRYVIPHDAGWIRHSDKVDMKRTIASTARNNDAIQTGVFNSVEWKL